MDLKILLHNKAGKAPKSDQGQPRCGSVVDKIQSDNFSEAINKLTQFWIPANYPTSTSYYRLKTHIWPNNLVISNLRV